ncbi:uncharacterized protein [Periplaneta americana]|uniref:uncharacterized protein isoform X2 n=1 Tax=Periplaneta americana TaxID=6978 RepID=UPI0037E83FB2
MSAPATPSEQPPPPAPPLEISASIITAGSQDIISSDSVVQSSHKLDDGGDGSPLPPALPPRPPPRPRQPQGGAAGAAALAQLASADQLEELAPGLEQQIRARVLRRSCWLRKYVFLCTACGGLAVLLGALFLTVYFMLRSYTSSLNYFETVPTYVPAAMLIVTGLIVMCLAGRRNRYGYLIKLCGGCCLACAVLCVIVTITTTVIHMNRLQMLRECVYTRMTQTCTCYPVPIESTPTARATSDIVHYVFNSTPDCEVIHGALYSCLRAMFGLSVIGILVCIFSCMLIYQLLSHEKKKMYWEQLEMRCRYLYRQQRNPHHCTCCDECRYPPPHQLFPWEVMDDRYWTPGRVGNLYSPNPGEDTGAVNLGTQRLRGQERATSGWSWRRLPWSRGSSANTGAAPDHSHREGPGSGVQNYRHATSSPDSQYGFSSHPAPVEGTSPSVPAMVEGNPGPYNIRDPHGGQVLSQPPGGFTGSRPLGPFVTEGSVKAIQQPQGYAQQYYMWGPPPPYSNPHSGNNSHCNSPARREPILNLLQGHQAPPPNTTTGSPSRLQHYQHHHHLHHHHHHCQMNQQANRGQITVEDQSAMSGQAGLMKNLQRHRGGVRRFQDQRRFDEFSSSSGDGIINVSDGDKSVIVENYVNTSEAEMATSGEVTTSENNTDSSVSKDRISNTLPARKAKKRIDISSVKSVANIPFSSEHQPGSQKSSPSHFSSANNANSGNSSGSGSGSGSAGNNGGGFPRTNVQVLFGQQGCQLSDHYHSGNHDDELSAEEAQLVAEKYPHSLPSSSALVRGKDGSVSGAPSGNMSPRMRYMSHLQGVTNAGFQGQEGLELQEQQGQILCGKNEPTESEVYFADVSSCCNVSVRNDGQDSSLYDEALDPQKHRLMILNQGEVSGIPTSSGHIQRLPDSYQMSDKTHHHHRRLLQADVMHPAGGHHQFQRLPLQEGVLVTDKGHQHHHRLISEGGALAISCDDQELTSNCFSYQRQSSTRSRLPFPLPHHHLSEQDSSTVEEDLQEGIVRKNVVASNREFIEAENMRKMGVPNNSRSDIPKDPSQQSLAMSSNSSATPTVENNDIAFVSPMSISTSSPGSFPTEELENCGSYYDNHNNNSSEVGSSSGSTSAVCSPMSSSGNDVFGSPSHGYPSPQKIPYDQGPVLQQTNRLHHMQQRNNNYHSPSHEANATDFVQLHGGDQHFLAPDAQYETIPQQQPQNIPQNPQAYQRHIHQQNFPPPQREDFNGNTPSNSPGKNNLSTRQAGMAASSATLNIGGNVTSPARRRLNLPLHVTSAGNTNVISSSNNNSIVESLYHTATSTEEEESESHQPQSSSNCYSDATMDSGCHSGSEIATRRRGGSARASARGGNGKEHSRVRTDGDEHGEEVTVTTMRSVNV